MKTKFLILASILVFMSCKNEAKQTPESNMTNDSLALVERARDIHERVITLDTHDDFNLNNFTDSLNYSQDLKSQVTLPKMEAGGLDVAWFIVIRHRTPYRLKVMKPPIKVPWIILM